MATSWRLLGNIERYRGNWDEAEKLYRQCLALRTELGDRQGMATSIACLGYNELGRGNLDTAEQLLTEALGKMEKLGMTWHIAETNYDLARLQRLRATQKLLNNITIQHIKFFNNWEPPRIWRESIENGTNLIRYHIVSGGIGMI